MEESMGIEKYEVPVDKLEWHCDPALFAFDCTKDLAPLREFVGQDRALRAIEFGLSMDRDGYNIYVAGMTGTGKTSAVKSQIDKLLAEKQALQQAQPPEDWLYIYNFSNLERPQVINLLQGKGKIFKEQMDGLLQRIKEELAKAFASEEYKTAREKAVDAGQSEQKKLFEEISDEALKEGFRFQITPVGPALIPLVDGKPLSQTEYAGLEETVRREIEKRQAELLEKLQNTYEKVRQLERETAEKLQRIDKEVADFTVARLFESLTQEYKDSEKIGKYLTNLKSYTLDNLDIFKEKEDPSQFVLGVPASYVARGRDPFIPFQVNIFVDNSGIKGPPVIVEPNPNYSNVFGRIERRFFFGGYLSDHTMLKPGALHLANDGYLLLNAMDVLTNPAVWPALKRAIKTKEVGIEDPLEQLGLMPSQGLRPEPVPVNVKVVLIGDRLLYQALSTYDEDFWETFRVKADFDYQIDRTKENMMAFAAFIAGCCEDCEMKHFDPTGVAKVMEYASRMVADQEKLSTRFAQIMELVQEAEYWARKDSASLVAEHHVKKAVEERRFRHNLPDERMRELIEDGTIMIDVDGGVVGQVNGLSVYSLGDVTFGKPSRITCKTFLGRGGVINIERESQLSGRIHDKGVMILSGYMGWKYAQDNPLSLSASLCFEQSYEGVEGDSAASAELYALLSSLSEVPIKQNMAVTGSVNQKGEIQPIGGVNQKIEGFFQICKAKGLTGEQGVVIPQRNLRNLMLREEVNEAIKQGKFHVYAVGSVDEGIEILTGIEVGQKKEDGTYPEGSINYRVDEKLKEMAAKLRQFAAPPADEKKNEGS
jgi:lon-related putative ATP-dependent protease